MKWNIICLNSHLANPVMTRKLGPNYICFPISDVLPCSLCGGGGAMIVGAYVSREEVTVVIMRYISRQMLTKPARYSNNVSHWLLMRQFLALNVFKQPSRVPSFILNREGRKSHRIVIYLAAISNRHGAWCEQFWRWRTQSWGWNDFV